MTKVIKFNNIANELTNPDDFVAEVIYKNGLYKHPSTEFKLLPLKNIGIIPISFGSFTEDIQSLKFYNTNSNSSVDVYIVELDKTYTTRELCEALKEARKKEF